MRTGVKRQAVHEPIPALAALKLPRASADGLFLVVDRNVSSQSLSRGEDAGIAGFELNVEAAQRTDAVGPGRLGNGGAVLN
jgi:hypothetical protein